MNNNGQLSEAVSFFQYSADEEKHERKPHAHWVTVSPDNRFLLVNDLGLDVIHVYRLDASTAQLTPHDPPLWRAKTGCGPRALQFHTNGRVAYCVNELKPMVDVLGWDGERGVLTTLQEVSLVPEDYRGNAAPSDIAFDRKMSFAYVASRLDDFIATFAVSPMDGKLTMIGKTSCGGRGRAILRSIRRTAGCLLPIRTRTQLQYLRVTARPATWRMKKGHFRCRGRIALYLFRQHQYPSRSFSCEAVSILQKTKIAMENSWRTKLDVVSLARWRR
jgi:hypothetical protein